MTGRLDAGEASRSPSAIRLLHEGGVVDRRFTSWHGASRRGASATGEAMQAVAAAEVLERLLQPGR